MFDDENEEGSRRPSTTSSRRSIASEDRNTIIHEMEKSSGSQNSDRPLTDPDESQEVDWKLQPLTFLF